MEDERTIIHVSKERARRTFGEVVALIESEVPGFEWREKPEVWTQVLIGFFLRWIFPVNRHYMADYTSTFYPRVYFPEGLVDDDPWRATVILLHERVHLLDAKKEGNVRFSLRYMMWWSLLVPLAIVAGVAFAVTGAPWWCYPMLVVAAIPFPSPWRRDYELRGYAMNALIEQWKTGRIHPRTRAYIQRKFTGPDYAWMWPFAKDMAMRLSAIETMAIFGAVTGYSPPYKEAIELLDDSRRAGFA